MAAIQSKWNKHRPGSNVSSLDMNSIVGHSYKGAPLTGSKVTFKPLRDAGMSFMDKE